MTYREPIIDLVSGLASPEPPLRHRYLINPNSSDGVELVIVPTDQDELYLYSDPRPFVLHDNQGLWNP